MSEFKTWTYEEYDPNGLHNDEVIKTEKEILEEYFLYWFDAVIESRGIEYLKELKIQDCIDDWVVVNWAHEVKDENSLDA